MYTYIHMYMYILRNNIIDNPARARTQSPVRYSVLPVASRVGCQKVWHVGFSTGAGGAFLALFPMHMELLNRLELFCCLA